MLNKTPFMFQIGLESLAQAPRLHAREISEFVDPVGDRDCCRYGAAVQLGFPYGGSMSSTAFDCFDREIPTDFFLDLAHGREPQLPH